MKPTTDTIARCRDTLATATALGLPVEAIPGTMAYEAHVTDTDEVFEWTVGTFPDRDSAVRALARWAIEALTQSGNEPWLRYATQDVTDEGDALLDQWLQSKTPEDVIEHYRDVSGDILTVNEIVISRALPRPAIPITAREIFAHQE